MGECKYCEVESTRKCLFCENYICDAHFKRFDTLDDTYFTCSDFDTHAKSLKNC